MSNGGSRTLRTNVYVDGFNLFYGCLKGTSYKWLDLEALSYQLLRQNEMHRIRYFTARISARGDPQGPVRQDTYLRALATLPSMSIHMGRFLSTRTRMHLAKPGATGPKTAEVMKTEEKGSDVNLATYLLVDAFRDDAEAFVVISNDSDLTEPIRIVKHELGHTVGILNPHSRPSQALLSCRPTFIKQIRKGVLAKSQLPSQLTDANGTITKPSSW